MAKLMLVEDDNNLREIYQARLQAEGYQIIPAKDGEEALVLAKSEKPDLIIADVMMPKISGFEMLDILRNTEGLKDVKVIMLTALGQNDDQQRATRLGADRYLVKSQVTLEDIVKVSHEILGDQAAPAAAAPLPTPPDPAPASQPAPVAAPATAPEPVPEPAPVAAPVPTAPVASQIPVTEPPPTPPDPAPAVPSTPAPAPAPDPTPVAPPAPAVEAATSSTATLTDSSTPESATSPLPDSQSSQDAQSVTQEEADVESKVEDFVAGATEEPTLPSGDPDPASPADEPTPPVSAPEPEPAPVEPKTDATASEDDKLMVDAAEALVNSTEPDTVSPTAPPAQVAIKVAAPSDSTPPADDPKPSSDGRSKKIIQPLDLQPKTDINTLLVLEEAEEAKSQAPPAPAAVVAVDDPKAPPAPVPPNPVIEPPATAEASGAADEPTPPVSTVQPNNPADPDSIAL